MLCAWQGRGGVSTHFASRMVRPVCPSCTLSRLWPRSGSGGAVCGKCCSRYYDRLGARRRMKLRATPVPAYSAAHWEELGAGHPAVCWQDPIHVMIHRMAAASGKMVATIAFTRMHIWRRYLRTRSVLVRQEGKPPERTSLHSVHSKDSFVMAELFHSYITFHHSTLF